MPYAIFLFPVLLLAIFYNLTPNGIWKINRDVWMAKLRVKTLL